jgi:hypothetical protein
LTEQNTERSAQVLKVYKALLAQHGVGLGVLLSGDPLSTTNESCACSQLNIFDRLIREGIIDTSTRIGIVSWTLRPQEVGKEVSERINFSLAHTANRIFDS